MKQLVKLKSQLLLLTMLLFSLLFQNCAVPVFSELQSARTVGKNNLELTPYVSFINQAVDGESDAVQTDFGIQAIVGLSDNTDLGLRFEHINVKDDFGGETYEIIGIVPKFGTANDRFAFALPVGAGFGSGIDPVWGVYPTFLVTIPIERDAIEFTLAPKYLLLIGSDDTSDFVAINFGMALSEDLSKWAIRPEYGLLYNPGEDGHNAHFSLGFSYTILSNK